MGSILKIREWKNRWVDICHQRDQFYEYIGFLILIANTSPSLASDAVLFEDAQTKSWMK